MQDREPHNQDAYPDHQYEQERASESSPIDSQRLFGGRREICIRHNGETYRLRVTKSGKLILNK